ncbi:hypothetical protein AGABI1DRAFT_123986 [Agaricus bisporus var. burnettii JB137-S8]|uniref:SprT-like domain-containing protein n=1 Tax=Agaricus bisporus var. burnettii (strain JB137-S8 / ATCC MYA-4627 / FGSC 10392) TaxID=597362 RepID=K5XJX9_AGABU|nr:uncharacterized protein AGABI1DRAFT_123986 [Agaricus bisporus var. burnettii JB137-S8]EKM83652.1 hypothetical protein AGABI1DRAFT_123986 [Agaricus bisporus var. burnettii JB137-S8]
MPPAQPTNSKAVRETSNVIDLGPRTPRSATKDVKHRSVKAKRVIIVSSDSEEAEEEEEEVQEVALTLKPSAPDDQQSECSCADEAVDINPPALKPLRNRARLPFSRRPVESSDSEVPPVRKGVKKTKKPLVVDVIELTSSSDEEIPTHSSKLVGSSQEHGSQRHLLPSYLSQEDGGAVLVFNEPKSARKPLAAITPKKLTPSKLSSKRATKDKVENVPTVVVTKRPLSTDTPDNKKSSVGTPKTNKSTGRVSKKALEKAEQIRRQEYAQELFEELNTSVFKNKLPHDTKLNWNKRLLTTAGRAKYRRSRDGTESSEIELAIKVLDCDERIRNTLSHEMCHLATWVIDKKLDENHGKLFKYWASKVTKRRPDIEISTRHDYEISYPYKWECQNCQKIYGRYSKSIRPDECVCGACREGQLIPLFTVRSKPQTPKLSRQAAVKAQDSPRSLPRLMDVHAGINDGVDPDGTPDTDTTDVENLIVALGSTHL